MVVYGVARNYMFCGCVTVTSTILHERRSYVCSTSCALSLSDAVREAHKWYINLQKPCTTQMTLRECHFVHMACNVFHSGNPWCLRQKLLLTKTGIPP